MGRRPPQSRQAGAVLERDLTRTLQRQDLSHFGGCRDLQRKLGQDSANLADLVGVGFGEFPFAEVEVVFEADSHVASHDRAGGDEVGLMLSGRENRPDVVVSEELVGDAAHVQQIFGVAADASQDAEDRLHEERRLGQTTIDKVGQVVEMPDVVALKLEPRPAASAEFFENRFDVGKRVLEDEVASPFEVLWFPRVLPVREFFDRGKQAEVHRAHVARAHLWLQSQRCGEPLLDRHVVSAAGCDVDDRVGSLLDLRQEFQKDFRTRRRATGLCIASVQMQNRRTGFGGLNRAGRDLVGRDRQIRRHCRRVNRTRDRASDDDFPSRCHRYSPSWLAF